jgi:hypothetical protein
MADTVDIKYEFERWMSQQGESAIYIGDGLYSRGAVCDQADAFRAGVEIGRAAALASRPAEVDDEGRKKLVGLIDQRVAALEQENADLRFNIGELMKAVATNKEK